MAGWMWLFLLVGVSAHAQDKPVVTYQARLSAADHRNAAGTPVSTAAAVLRQDRTNYHLLNKRDAEDQADTVFSDPMKRVDLERLASALPADVSEAILAGTPLVEVAWHGTRVTVRVVSGLPVQAPSAAVPAVTPVPAASPVPAPAPVQNGRCVIADGKVNGVGIESRTSAVKPNLPAGWTVRQGPGEWTDALIASDAGRKDQVVYQYGGETVVHIRALTGDCRTSSGLGLGSTLADVLRQDPSMECMCDGQMFMTRCYGTDCPAILAFTMKCAGVDPCDGVDIPAGDCRAGWKQSKCDVREVQVIVPP